MVVMVRELLIAFGIMGVCLVIHVTGILFLGEELVRHRQKSKHGSVSAMPLCC